MKPKGFAIVPLLIMVGAVIAFGAVGYFVLVSNSRQDIYAYRLSPGSHPLCKRVEIYKKTGGDVLATLGICEDNVTRFRQAGDALNLTTFCGRTYRYDIPSGKGALQKGDEQCAGGLSIIENPLNNTNVASGPTISVAAAIERAGQYDDQPLCLVGWYQLSFEFSAMAETYEMASTQSLNAEPRKILLEPYVWVDATVSESGLTCTTSEVGEKSCIGQIVQCGTLRYAAPGEDGFGHVGAYRFELERLSSPPSSNTIESTNRSDLEQNFNLNLANSNASTNANLSQQTNGNTGATVLTADGVVSIACRSDQDCLLIKKSREYSVCCPMPFCPEYDDSDFIAVNGESFTTVVQAAKDARESCFRVDCPQYSPPSCPTTTSTIGIAAKCVSGVCQKVLPAAVQPQAPPGYSY